MSSLIRVLNEGLLLATGQLIDCSEMKENFWPSNIEILKCTSGWLSRNNSFSAVTVANFEKAWSPKEINMYFCMAFLMDLYFRPTLLIT